MSDLRWLSTRTRVIERVYDDTEPPEWVGDRWLRPSEVAALLQVSRRTVSDWAREGRIASIMTPGGHRRFRADHVRALLESLVVDAAGTPKGRSRGPSDVSASTYRS